jgi:hypothetical protein
MKALVSTGENRKGKERFLTGAAYSLRRPTMSILRMALLSAIWLTGAVGAGAADRVLLGINYTHYRLDKEALSQCDRVRNGPLSQGGIISQYEQPKLRSVVTGQLTAMRGAGFEAVRTFVWYRSQAPDAKRGLISSRPEALETKLENVTEFVADVAAAGFSQLVLVFGPVGENSPYCRREQWGDCFDESRRGENWNTIVRVREAALRGAAGKIDVHFDLSNEACPSRFIKNVYAGNSERYIKDIYARYVGTFGSRDVRISCAVGDSKDRLGKLLEIYRQVGHLPPVAEIHSYDADPATFYRQLKEAHEVLAGTNMKLVLGEVLFQNLAQAAVLNSFMTLHSDHRITGIFQWPLSVPGSQCGQDVEPPFSPGPYLGSERDRG